jgi:hypothetical protein
LICSQIQVCFSVELVDGVVDGLPVGKVDTSLGEGGGDLFGGAPGGFVVESVLQDGQVGVDRVNDRADPVGTDVASGEAKRSHRRSTSGRAARWSVSRMALRGSQLVSSSMTSPGLQYRRPAPM